MQCCTLACCVPQDLEELCKHCSSWKGVPVKHSEWLDHTMPNRHFQETGLACCGVLCLFSSMLPCTHQPAAACLRGAATKGGTVITMHTSHPARHTVHLLQALQQQPCSHNRSNKQPSAATGVVTTREVSPVTSVGPVAACAPVHPAIRPLCKDTIKCADDVPGDREAVHISGWVQSAAGYTCLVPLTM